MPRNKYKAITPLFISFISFVVLVLVLWITNNDQHKVFLSSLEQGSISTQKMSLLAELIEIARSRTRLTSQMIEEEDIFNRDEINLTLDILATRFYNTRSELLKTKLSSTELKIINDQDKVIMRILPRQREAARLAMSGNDIDLPKARKILIEEVLPGQSIIVDQFMKLIKNLNKQVNNLTASSHTQYQQYEKNQYVLLFIILSLTIVVSIYSGQKIVSVEHDLSTERERAELTLTSIQDGVMVIDQYFRIYEINQTALDFMNINKERTIGSLLTETIIKADVSIDNIFLEGIEKILKGDIGKLRNDEVTLSIKGSYYNVDMLVSPILQEEEITGAIITFRDITEQKKLTDEIEYQAKHDSLTGLYNRHTFDEQCETIIRQTHDNTRHVLCLLDLDRFKVVNDTAGHTAGDELLKQITTLLIKNTRANELISRIGGDEFAILLQRCDIENGKHVVSKIIKQISDYRFDWNENSFVIGCSAGMIEIDQHMKNFNDLFHSADTACYLAKDEGRNRYKVFDSSSIRLSDKKEESNWVNKINHALEKNLFFIELQPIVLTRDINAPIPKLEVLIRLDENGKTVLPMSFLPTAERYGLIGDIDNYILKKAIDLIGKNENCPMLSINLSGKTLSDPELTEKIIKYIANQTIDLRKVCFEVTETEMIANFTNALDFINKARELGIKISLDDFGSGLSSFNYLDTLSLDYIKIDGAFIQKMLTSKKTRAMVESINHIAHTIGMETIAEYIDSDELVEISKEIEIDYLQGYLVGRPKRAEAYGLIS